MQMMEMVDRFPKQLKEAMDIAKAVQLKPLITQPNLIYVTGMGGSGIGADFVSCLIKDKANIPYIVNKTYETPKYINENCLVIASSYSGNTEETITNLKKCIDQGARFICIASGGKIIELAKIYGADFVLLPNNWPSPRACLGYSLVTQLFLLMKLQIIDQQFEFQLQNTIQFLEAESNSIKEKAKHLAASLLDKRVIIYSTDRLEPVAIRFRQQINENAKQLCWHHVIPEMNHNELVGWRNELKDTAVIFLRNSDDYERNQARIDLTKEVVSHYASSVIELFSKGISPLERSFYLIHLLDYVTVYMAENKKIDAVEVKVIDYLKSELSKL